MASGDPDTYLSNTILNVLLQAYVAFKAGVPIEDLSVVASGDDSVVIVEKQSALFYERFDRSALLSKLGFTCRGTTTREPFDHKSPLGYCSAVFAKIDVDKYALLPKPGRVLSKVVWQRLACNQTQPDLARYKGDLLGLWPSGQHVPVLREFLASELMRLSELATTHTAWQQLTSTSVVSPHLLPKLTQHQRAWARYRYGPTAERICDRGWFMTEDRASLTEEMRIDL